MALTGHNARDASERCHDADVEESGRAWAQQVRARLEHEGRRASGGWPGTLSEARARLDTALSSLATRVSGSDERERLARILYHAARELWLTHRVPLEARVAREMP